MIIYYTKVILAIDIYYTMCYNTNMMGLYECEAMKKAGITDPDSQAGIDFCVKQCPYDRCIAVEGTGKSRDKHITDKIMSRQTRALLLYSLGYSVEYIAEVLGVQKGTVRRDLRRT